MTKLPPLITAALTLSILPTLAFGQSRVAPDSHGWGGYHWGRVGTSPASIVVYDSTATTNIAWGTQLNRAIFGDASNPNATDRRGWNNSAVLSLSVSAAANDASTRSSCSAVNNAVRVCNYTYGSNGWLGLASINTVSGSTVHIAWGTAKMNDTYFAGGYPSTEKRHVMCQEVGHTFGLGHTSTDGSSQNTCMDYYQNTSSSDWTSTGPNQHDFDQLAVQAHYSGVTTKLVAAPVVSAALSAGISEELVKAYRFVGDGELNAPWQWGTPFHFDREGRADEYKLDLGEDSDGNEYAIYTFVTWADGQAQPRREAARAEN
ncbi:MAG: hypothetical protein ABI837_08440 [Acidobacteriota bacterium]